MCLAGKMLAIAGGGVPLWLTLPLIGLIATAVVGLGGMKAVIWTDVIQLTVIAVGLLLLIAGAWWSLDGGSAQVWQSAVAFHRTAIADLQFSWASTWTIWALLPHFLIALLALGMSDPLTVQRWLAAKSLGAARRSAVLSCLSLTIMVPGLVYLGLCLLAFFQTHPQQMRPIWVANVDSTTHQSITDPATRNRPLIDPTTGRPKKSLLSDEVMMDPSSGRPLIDWDRDPLNATTIEQLIAEGRVLHPNRKEPLAASDGLIDEATGELVIDKLAVRRGNEIVLHVRAANELLPRFIAGPHSIGATGLMLAVLMSAALVAFNSGLISILAELLLLTGRTIPFAACHETFHPQSFSAPARHAERDGYVAITLRVISRSFENLVSVRFRDNDLYFTRQVLPLIGIAATLLAMALSPFDDAFRVLLAAFNTFAAPLLAVFLLAMFSRRCTSAAALAALIFGVMFAVWFQLSTSTTVFAWLWPLPIQIAEVWVLPLTATITFALGMLLSLFLGQRKTKAELRGLVVGIGEAGNRTSEPRVAIQIKME